MFFHRTKGAKQTGLDALVPYEERLHRLMPDRYYRLAATTTNRTSTTTTRLHRTLKKIELTMKDFNFSREDPILIFDFLRRLVQEDDTLDMNEGQLMVYFVFHPC